MTGYQAAKPDGRPPRQSNQAQSDNTAHLARVRENQRRSRARRKEYLHELESKFRQCEQTGIEATSEMQAAARRVLEENERLRNFLRSKGFSEDDMDAYPTAEPQTAKEEQKSGAARGLEDMMGNKKPCCHKRVDSPPSSGACESSDRSGDQNVYRGSPEWSTAVANNDQSEEDMYHARLRQSTGAARAGVRSPTALYPGVNTWSQSNTVQRPAGAMALAGGGDMRSPLDARELATQSENGFDEASVWTEQMPTPSTEMLNMYYDPWWPGGNTQPGAFDASELLSQQSRAQLTAGLLNGGNEGFKQPQDDAGSLFNAFNSTWAMEEA